MSQQDLALPSNIDIPNELSDQITCELLLDPVRLPSGYCYNRSTIDLLIKEGKLIDPIANSPFKPEDVEPANDIKKKAEEFFKQHAVPKV